MNRLLSSRSISPTTFGLGILLFATLRHLMLFCNLLFSTMVLLGVLYRHFSWRSCFQNDFFGGDVNRGEVFELLDVSFSPPDRQLRRSENLVVLPSAQCRGMVATLFLVLRLRLSHGLVAIDCVRAFFFVNEFLNDNMALSKLQIWLWSCSSCLDLVGAKRHIDTRSIPLVRVSGKKDTEPLPRFVSVRSTLGCPSRKSRDLILHWRSYHFFLSSRHERTLCMIHFSTSPTFLLISFICSSSFKMAFWGTPFTRRAISNFGFLSTGETEFHSSFLELIEPGSVVVAFDIPILSPNRSFLELAEALSESCCCCDCQLHPSVTFGAGRGVEILSNSVRCPFWEITLSMQFAGTGLCTMIALDFVCQNRNPWSFARDNFFQYTASWSCFQLLWSCTFLGIVKSSLGASSSGFAAKGLKVWRRWSVVIPCFVFLLQWARSQGWSWCWRNKLCGTQTLSKRKEFKRFPPTQAQL